MRRLVSALAAVALPLASVNAADPTPRELLAQAPVDDSDIVDEKDENLEDLNEEEYQDQAWSTGAAIGLSFIPGGGFGLVYAKKPYHSVVPFLLSAVGYGLGAVYLAGVFDKDSREACQHGPSASEVPFETCGFGDDPNVNLETDPRSPTMDPYFRTKGDYAVTTVGENFDGKETGIYILAGTYIATTLLGAIWSGSIVSSHNDEIRKNIESTASAPRPIIGYDGQRGVVGLVLDF